MKGIQKKKKTYMKLAIFETDIKLGKFLKTSPEETAWGHGGTNNV